ncbi:MAG: YopX family protein [Halanaerobiales bacterium]
MREIKVKGKRKDNKEWIQGYYFSAKNKHYVLPVGNGDIRELKPSHETMYGFYEVIPETVGQFTGEKDKKGKEIYEGDILKIWIEGILQNNLYIIEDLREFFRFCNCVDSYFRITDRLIIGNKHENPELVN